MAVTSRFGVVIVETIGYGGFLLGAPMIGFLAHMMSLDRALIAVALIALLIAILAPAARERNPEPDLQLNGAENAG